MSSAVRPLTEVKNDASSTGTVAFARMTSGVISGSVDVNVQLIGPVPPTTVLLKSTWRTSPTLHADVKFPAPIYQLPLEYPQPTLLFVCTSPGRDEI